MVNNDAVSNKRQILRHSRLFFMHVPNEMHHRKLGKNAATMNLPQIPCQGPEKSRSLGSAVSSASQVARQDPTPYTPMAVQRCMEPYDTLASPTALTWALGQDPGLSGRPPQHPPPKICKQCQKATEKKQSPTSLLA
ncbi:hypothetical protein PWT90_04288 [Aphanocladium album]|nr:hypothetical protein PWT90_04288 [Aphanocladium album]